MWSYSKLSALATGWPSMKHLRDPAGRGQASKIDNIAAVSALPNLALT
jgi:hypothetical protein